MLLRVVDNLVISFKMEHLEYEAADEVDDIFLLCLGLHKS